MPVDPEDDVSIGPPTPSGTASALDATQLADGTVLARLAVSRNGLEIVFFTAAGDDTGSPSCHRAGGRA